LGGGTVQGSKCGPVVNDVSKRKMLWIRKGERREVSQARGLKRVINQKNPQKKRHRYCEKKAGGGGRQQVKGNKHVTWPKTT